MLLLFPLVFVLVVVFRITSVLKIKVVLRYDFRLFTGAIIASIIIIMMVIINEAVITL